MQSNKLAIKNILEDRFPNSKVGTLDGCEANVHVLVVSNEFNGLTETESSAIVWNALWEKLDSVAILEISSVRAFEPKDNRIKKAFDSYRYKQVKSSGID